MNTTTMSKTGPCPVTAFLTLAENYNSVRRSYSAKDHIAPGLTAGEVNRRPAPPHLESQPALETCAPLAHLLTCPSCGTRNPPPLCMFAATGRHYRSWYTAADFLALVRRFSSCRPPRTTPPRAHGPLWPALFYETAGAWFWWWAHEPASWGDVWYCVCLILCRVAFLDSCMCSGLSLIHI